MARGAPRGARLGHYFELDKRAFAGLRRLHPQSNEAQIPSFESLRGHQVEITGTIRMRDGCPIIMMTDSGAWFAEQKITPRLPLHEIHYTPSTRRPSWRAFSRQDKPPVTKSLSGTPLSFRRGDESHNKP